MLDSLFELPQASLAAQPRTWSSPAQLRGRSWAASLAQRAKLGGWGYWLHWPVAHSFSRKEVFFRCCVTPICFPSDVRMRTPASSFHPLEGSMSNGHNGPFKKARSSQHCCEADAPSCRPKDLVRPSSPHPYDPHSPPVPQPLFHTRSPQSYNSSTESQRAAEPLAARRSSPEIAEEG